jgi:hypothetical protein
MLENRALIDQVCIRFVFIGDPEEAERSQVLDKLREDLENKKHFVDHFFEARQVTLLVEFRSATGRLAQPVTKRGRRCTSFGSPTCSLGTALMASVCT